MLSNFKTGYFFDLRHISIFTSISLFIYKSYKSTLLINDYFTHDIGTLLSTSVHPFEAIRSLKGLTFPGSSYGTSFGAYLLSPFTFFEVDLYSIQIFFNFTCRYVIYLVLALYLFRNKRNLLGYFAIFYPLTLNSEVNFTWGFYAYSETELIFVLIVFLVLNKDHVKLILFLFFILGIFLRLDMRGGPILLFALILFHYGRNYKWKEYIEYFLKNLSLLLLGFLLTNLYISWTKPVFPESFEFDFMILPTGLERISTFIGIPLIAENIGLSFLLNSIISFVILFISKQLTLDKFKIVLLYLSIFFIFIIFMSGSRMIESYATMNPNRIFITWPFVIILLFHFLTVHNFYSLKQSRFFVFVPVGLIPLFLYLSLIPVTPPNLGTQGPAPILERLTLKKDCENLAKLGPNIGTEYIETIDWRLGFTCDALLIPDKRYKFINANSMGLGEVRPWRREVINR
jgi:hypothetical protein